MNTTTCPICAARMPGDWTEYPDYPFCSKRCRLIDLGRWLGEGYRVSHAGDPDRSSPPETPGDAR
jgi:endogenous inhibitor of DNA gyrase (YacG/DUF329 family)